MTSVQDYLRNLRAARKEFVNKTVNEASPSVAAPAAAVPQTVASSPWLRSPTIPQPSSAAVRSDLGRGEPASAARQSTARATSTPLKPSQTRPGGVRLAAEEVDSDTDTDISHLIDQLSLKSAPKPPPAPPSAAAAAGAAPRRVSKMDMLRRKFSASSPTKSWTDLGSSGGAASLGRARTRSRSSVSILDQKIILSGISGDEDSSGSSSSSGGTSLSNPIRTESAPGARRWRRSASDGEVSEELEASGADSVVPTVPSASSVQTETAPTAASVETESVETGQPTEGSVQTEEPTEESVSSDSESTIKSVSGRSAKSKQARAVRSAKSDSKSTSESDSKSESESVSQSESESESESESSVVPAKAGPAAVSSESTPLAVAAGGASAQDREDDPASTPVVRSHRKQSDPASARADRRAAKRQEAKRQEAKREELKRQESKRQEAKRQEAKRQDKTERSAWEPSKQHRVSARRDRDRSKGEHTHPHDTSARDRHRGAKRASKPHDEGRSARDSRSHRRAEPAAARERTGGAELASPSERRRRRRRDRDRDRDASWPEFELERTDASESLVVSYQRRVTRSSGGCRHCCRQAWPPPPPPAVTVVVPPAALSGAVGVGDAVRFSTAANSAVFVDADEDAVLSAILTQQVALTRHFLATQKHLHQMYCRALRQTQRQVYTHREDLKGSGRRRRRGGVPPD